MISVSDRVENISGKKRKYWLPAFSPFSPMFYPISEREINISATFTLSTANAFNLDLSKILSFGKELNHSS